MKIFISHASKDGEIANAFSRFIERIAPVNVFCSSEQESILVGQNFVGVITKELQECDAFIPVISPNYYKSKFCMIELGFAFGKLVEKQNEGQNYIFPVALPPVKKAECLANSPLSHIKVGCIHDSDELRAYIDSVFDKHFNLLKAGLNGRINEFVYEIKQYIFSKYDVNSDVRHLVCKSQNVPGEDEDYLQYSILPDRTGHTVNFRAKPFLNSKEYPDFLSFVYKYVDKIDLYEPTTLFPNPCLKLCINNYTNSIKKIDIEIKYSDNNVILHKQTITLQDGENAIIIPLQTMKCEALKNVSEICFVIKPSAYVEDEGMLQIYGFELDTGLR